MTSIFSSDQIRSQLSVHRIFGMASAAILYLVCLSGTVVVFHNELLRLEQPEVEETFELPAQYHAKIINEYLQRIAPQREALPETVYLVMPTQDLPRPHVTDGIDEWYLDAQGEFLQQPDTPWTEMITGLHTHLHLPHVLGSAIIGLTGVLMTALIFSGVVAHPTIFKDAFRLRRQAADRLQATDWHNRLSVWGLPFHLMIGITGAFMGISTVLVGVLAALYFDNNQEQAIAAVYGDDPVVESRSGSVDYPTALANLEQHAPAAEPIYLALHRPGQTDQLLEIAARLPDRLTYSEIYRFDADGQLINHQGLADGPIGRQVAYSTYRLHFGNFASLQVKVLYAMMGIALSMVCVYGVNIWLSRKKVQGPLRQIWQGWVWGLPAVMLLCLILSWLPASWLPLNLTATFWLLLLLVTAGSALIHRQEH